jgi:hypothetical protein
MNAYPAERKPAQRRGPDRKRLGLVECERLTAWDAPGRGIHVVGGRIMPYADWCRCQAFRLLRRDVYASVVEHLGHVAVFRAAAGYCYDRAPRR